MSYDLDFWKERAGVLVDVQDTYERLSSGEFVEGLKELPTDQMFKRIRDSFPDGWVQIDEQNWESADEDMEVFITPYFLRIDCVALSDEGYDVFLQLSEEFNCPMYDPQTGNRAEVK